MVDRRQSRFHELELDRDEVLEQIVDGPPTLGSALGIVLRAYATGTTSRAGATSGPSYFQYTDVLLRLFPDAQFVHLIRDGRDCVASLKEMPWYNGSVYSAVCAWAEAIDFARHGAPKLPEGSYHELRYEDLTADPEAHLRRLCEFLGEDFAPAMCEPSTLAGIAVPARKTWHARTHGEVTTSRTGTWRERLDPGEISLCESVLGDRLETYGYELSGAPKIETSRMVTYEKTAAKRKLARVKRVAFDRLMRLREPNQLGARLTSGQIVLAGVPMPRNEPIAVNG